MIVLIAGCGYLGKRAAELLRASGHEIIALTRSAESAEALRNQGWEARACDISDAHAVGELPAADAVLHCAASGGGGAIGYQQVYIDGCRNLLAAFPHRPFVFVSSTSVYPQIDGSIVDENSPADPALETGRLLRQAENLALAAGATVLRLAGIYGPQRSVLLKQFLLGQAHIDVRRDPPLTPDGRWINQIHRADAAAAIAHVIRTDTRAEIFNVTDSTPMTQRDIFAGLAARFSLPLPPERAPAADRKRGWSHKRVSNARLQAAGWSPRFVSWFDALDHDPDLVPSIMAQVGL
jgi:nucleoside-diphosphate-sugar epimerase